MPISIHLPTDVLRQVDRRARSQGLSRSGYITRALRREASRAWGAGEAGQCWCLELLAALGQLLLETPATPNAAAPSQAPGPQ